MSGGARLRDLLPGRLTREIGDDVALLDQRIREGGSELAAQPQRPPGRDRPVTERGQSREGARRHGEQWAAWKQQATTMEQHEFEQPRPWWKELDMQTWNVLKDMGIGLLSGYAGAKAMTPVTTELESARRLEEG